MISRKQFIQHACPTCNVEYGFLAEKAGHETTCNYCNTTYPIPVGLPVEVRDLSTDPRRTLTAEETAEFYNSPAGRAYLASQVPKTGGALARRVVPAEMVPQDYYTPPAAVQRPIVRPDGDKKVKLSFLKWFGIEVDVDSKTRSAMATTALGGILVGLGAIIAAKCGIKTKA